MPKRELQPLRIGYARVSTHDQNLEMQLNALNKTGCKRIFTDKLSGAQVERTGLKEALAQLREADTLVVWKLDRLGRSVKGLVDLINELETQKVHFQSITDGINTKTPAGRFFFHVMASLAQMERGLIMERTRAGLQAARLQGRVGGRKRQMTDSKIQAARKLLASGTPPHEVAHSLGVSVPTLYPSALLLGTEGDADTHRLHPGICAAASTLQADPSASKWTSLRAMRLAWIWA